ncbi:hypothetical protein AB6G19_24675 [Providencia manganoxydans]|uniref:hypothetical protein n=1 Tax=Morganellaceae TaxID=1903414 RepID=UPI001E70FB0F|nr:MULTISPECIES: hypothetical protein [Providencia]MCR4182067.1 hypothetical protein [Providencia vermicola]CAB5569533.1 Uncharacterised protein [Providencia rettgeri]CAC9177898.1 Uncharacterised protein [Providencia rettgeri]CAD0188177.1 Hypothetical_protein [Providencia rettgeri]
MSNSNDTIDYTIRGIPIALDLVISELAAAERLPKSTYIRNKLSEIFLNRYDQYAATSSLVAAYDEKLARDLGTTVKHVPIDNFMATPDKIAFCEILNIKEDRDLENILVENGKYILQRARRTILAHDNVPVLTACSLWFALFCELAGASQKQIDLAEVKIFNRFNTRDAYYKYIENINAIRESKGIQPILPREADAKASNCHVRIYKPHNYQFGAWRVEITLSKKAESAIKEIAMTFPEFKNRILIAEKADGYLTAVTNSSNEYENGFLIKNGESKLDLYSSGLPEEANPTSITEVAEVLAEHINNNICQHL